MGVGLIAIGVLWILSLTGVDLRRELTLPGALIATGLLDTLGVRWSAGLVELGIIVTDIALDTSALATPAPVSAGDPSVAVSSVAELESSYWLGTGTLTLDTCENSTCRRARPPARVLATRSRTVIAGSLGRQRKRA